MGYDVPETLRAASSKCEQRWMYRQRRQYAVSAKEKRPAGHAGC